MITPFSTKPLSTQPNNFDSDMDIRIAEQDRFVAEANALALEMDLYATYGPGTQTALTGLKNRVINSSCRVAQEGQKSLALGSWVHGGCDLIPCLLSATTGSGTLQQAVIGYGSGYSQSALVTSTGATNVYFQHRIEKLNVSDLQLKTVTAFAWVLSDASVPVTAAIGINKPTAGINNFVSQTQLAISTALPIQANVPTLISVTYTMPAYATDLGLSVQVVFSTTAVTSKYFIVSDIGLVQGSIVPNILEPVDYHSELKKCQYYIRPFSVGTQVFYLPIGNGYGISFPIEPMYGTPVVSNFALTTQTNITGTVTLSGTNNALITLTGGTATVSGSVQITQNGNAFLKALL